MSSSRQSPLHGVTGGPGEVLALAERAFEGHINLRGNAGDGRFTAAVHAVLGVAPPVRPNTVASDAGILLIWLGPDEWLVQVDKALRAPVLEKLRQALAGQFAAVTDVSDGQTVLVLDDPRATELLARGCPLDLHESVFPVGSCAQSVFGKTGVLLVRETPQRFAITVRRSFARYFYAALQDAARMVIA